MGMCPRQRSALNPVRRLGSRAKFAFVPEVESAQGDEAGFQTRAGPDLEFLHVSKRACRMPVERMASH